MAITIDYSDSVTPQYVIQIPRADMLDVTAGGPTEIRQLNINDFRLQLNDLMDDVIGMHFPTNHVHVAPITVAGVTLARVVEILNPYVIEFEDGSYNVNIVGGNSNISDVTVKNQVGVNTANSAGLQDPFALQAAAFGSGEICIDATSTTTGTAFPFGTRGFPVNNVADALEIAQSRGIRNIRFLSNFTLSSGDFSDGYNFEGDNPNVVLTINSAPDVMNCEFRNMTIQGDLDGGNTLRECVVLDLNYFNGFIFQCGLAGTLTLLGTSTATILQSFSLVAGGGSGQYPVIDLGGTQDTPLILRDWQGGIGIENCSVQNASSSIDLSSGRIIFDATVSAGAFTVRGLGDVEDNSTGTCVVTDKTINNTASRTRKHLTNKMITDPVTGVATLYDDDGVTVLESSQMYEDAAGTQPYQGQGAERREGYS